ncbi:unnamed protein product [Hymenolepis diminuta]|uniref:DUF148 domain-containing protein n=1 Tax=Hymenolepis diminuta TaxID=6216 RepID=A0A564YSW6_HYMDI|nr:unnamed protein product [Hymenolepis diminuta]
MKGLLITVFFFILFVVLISCSPIPKNENSLQVQRIKKTKPDVHTKRSISILKKSPRKRKSKLPKKSNKSSFRRRRGLKIMKAEVKGNKLNNTIEEQTTTEPILITIENANYTTTPEPETFFSTQNTYLPTNFTEMETEITISPAATTAKSKTEKSEIKKKKNICRNRDNQQRGFEDESITYYPGTHDPILFPIIPLQQTGQINPVEYKFLNPLLPVYDQVFQWHYEPWPYFHHDDWKDSEWLARDRKPKTCKCKNKKKKKEPAGDSLRTVTVTTQKLTSSPGNAKSQKVTTEDMTKTTILLLYEEIWNELKILIEEYHNQMRTESNPELRKRLAKQMKKTLEDDVNYLKNLTKIDSLDENLKKI